MINIDALTSVIEALRVEERPDSITPEVLGAVLQQIADLINGAGSDAELDEIADQIAALGVTDTSLLDKIDKEISDRKASIKEVVNRRANNLFSFKLINALTVDSTESAVKAALKTDNFPTLIPMKIPDDFTEAAIRKPRPGDMLYNSLQMVGTESPSAIVTEAASKSNNWFSFTYEYGGKCKTIKISEAYKVLSVTELVVTDELDKKVESEGYDSVVGDLEANLLTDALRKTPQVLSADEQLVARGNIGAQGQLSTSADLVLSSANVLSLTDMAKKRLFIDLWNNAAGSRGRYNEETGYFELYEVHDIGWDEALMIYRISGQWDLYSFSFNVNTKRMGYGHDIRVLLPFVSGENGEASFTADTRFHNETLQYLAFCRQNVPWFYMFLSVQTHGFRFPQLKKIYDEPLRIQNVVSSAHTFNMPKLEYAKFWFMNSNYTTIYFRANLNYECSNYLFSQIPTQNANKQCVFKLAANMFNRLSGTATDYDISGGTKEEWMAIADLAASKNITLATE